MTTKLKPTYEIANYLPMALRRQIVSRTYRWDEAQGSLICATGRCPLGWLFADTEEDGYLIPCVWDITERISARFPTRVKDISIIGLDKLAATFVDAWDRRLIHDLHKALGVPK